MRQNAEKKSNRLERPLPIRSLNRSLLIKYVVFSLIFVSVSGVSIYVIRDEAANNKPFPYWSLVMPALALPLVVYTICMGIGFRKFGHSWFHIDSHPASVGNELRGTIVTSRKIPDETLFRLKLVCIHREVSGYGRNRAVTHEALFKTKRTDVIQEQSGNLGTSSIPVRFFIPSDCKPTSHSNSRSKILWYLEVAAEVRGMNYGAVFEIPVLAVTAPIDDKRSSTLGRSKNRRK